MEQSIFHREQHNHDQVHFSPILTKPSRMAYSWIATIYHSTLIDSISSVFSFLSKYFISSRPHQLDFWHATSEKVFPRKNLTDFMNLCKAVLSQQQIYNSESGKLFQLAKLSCSIDWTFILVSSFPTTLIVHTSIFARNMWKIIFLRSLGSN